MSTSTPQSDDLVITMHRGDPPRQFLEVVRPYLPSLSNEDALARYCRTADLGDPFHAIAKWKGRVAGVNSVFPFPLTVDGTPVIIGKPEFAYLHQDVAFSRSPRPDIFGLLIDEVTAEARTRQWPLVIGWPTPMSAKSHKKRGYQILTMPITAAYWSFTPTALAGRVTARLKRFPLLKQRPGLLRVASWMARRAVSMLSTLLRLMSSTLARAYTVSEVDASTLREMDDILTPNYWTQSRLAPHRRLDHLVSRLRPEDGYFALRVEHRSKPERTCIALVRFDEGLFHIFDLLPPQLMSRPGIWLALIRFARNLGADTVRAHFYRNNPYSKRAVRALRTRLPGLYFSSTIDFTVYVFDPEYDFAYSVENWAGSDMLGFGY
ncbi:MAG: hypothetical protein GY906_00495 [bacterium]|nr:hypothetical protein [bacterium]